MKSIRAALAAILFSLLIFAASASAFTVVSVHDGDTCTLQDDAGSMFKVRLGWIDAPELKQTGGAEARDALAAIILGKNVDLIELATDHYGRTVGLIFQRGRLINVDMVATGWAYVYPDYAKEAPWLAGVEYFAQANGQGMWGMEMEPKAPWEWRRERRVKK